MQLKLLDLHFSQLQSEWKDAKYNSYSDLRKKEYHDKLVAVISALEKEDFSTFNDTDITQRFYVIYFLFKSLEFLNNSTTSTIPFEIVTVLSEALKDWSPTDEYIIVTSLVNGMNSFSFDNSLMTNDFIYRVIELLYGVKFEKKLVQINLPRSISRDYLANVVLYHELGHFIDRTFEITRVIYIELLAALKGGKLKTKELADVHLYFPYLVDPDEVDYYLTTYHPNNQLANHIAEYFCDLFASQYIKNSSNYYLDYITLEESKFSVTHPSTVNRIDFVNKFLKKKASYLLEHYKKVVLNITGINIDTKSTEIKSKNFENLIPIEITDRKELHGLFIYGWSVWMADWGEIKRHSKISFDLPAAKVYEIINNLIEKSIGNYIVKKEWELAKST